MARGSISERNGAWYLRVYLGMSNGQRQYATQTVRGTKKDADLALARLLSAVGDGKVSAPTRATLGTYLEEWHAIRTDAMSGTRKKWRDHLDDRIIPALGEQRLTALSTEEIDRFYGKLRREGLTPSYVKSIHGTLHGALEDAVRWKRLAVNPASRAKPGKIPKRPVDPPTAGAVGDFIAELEEPAFAAFLLLKAGTGARRSEILALQLRDLAEDRVLIRRRLTKGETGGYEVADLTKNGTTRTVRIGPFTAEALGTHVLAMKERALTFGVKLKDRAFVFSDDPASAKPWHPDTTSHKFRRWADRLGILEEDDRLNDLRHSHVTELLDAGVPIATVSKRIGHSRQSTTVNFYLTDEPQGDGEAANVAEERLRRRA